MENPSPYTVRNIVSESLPILGAVLGLALVTGNILDSRLAILLPHFPLILLAIPGFINITGDLASVVGARITSHLYTGELDSRLRPHRLLAANILAPLLVAATAFTLLAASTILLSHLLLHPLPPQYVTPFFLAILASGLLATTLSSLIGLVGAIIVYRSGRDPDSIIPPITTTTGDLLGILFVTWSLIAIVG